jgi:hypothetical protein
MDYPPSFASGINPLFSIPGPRASPGRHAFLDGFPQIIPGFRTGAAFLPG